MEPATKEEMLRLREELITLSAIVRSKNSTPVTMYQDKTRSSWKTAAVLEFQRLQTSMNEGAKLRESVKRCKVEAERIQNAFTKNFAPLLPVISDVATPRSASPLTAATGVQCIVHW